MRLKFRTRLREGNKKTDKSGGYDVVLLEEGLGNLNDGHYYTRQALQSAIPVFEGKKIYSDHPSLVEEQSLPERSVRSILGHYQDVHTEETDDGRHVLAGNLITLQGPSFDWANSLMQHSLEYAQKYPDKDFVGLSINAFGDHEERDIDSMIESGEVPSAAIDKLAEAKAQGMRKVKVVTKFTEAVSCDLVTEPGAGGHIRQMLEQQKGMSQMAKGKAKEAIDPSGKVPGKQDGLSQDSMNAEAAPAADHPDQAQDIDLISKMMKQYLGDGDHTDDDKAMANECMGMAKEMGLEGDSAMQMAGSYMKMKKHSDMKQASSAKSNVSVGAGKGANDKSAVQVNAEAGKPATGGGEPIQESEDLIRLKGENAGLKAQIAEMEAKAHLDTVLSESGLPRAVTKKFREALGEVKSKDQIDKTLKVFLEGYKALEAGRGEASPADSAEDSFVLNIEKQFRESDSGKKGGKAEISLKDCVE